MDSTNVSDRQYDIVFKGQGQMDIKSAMRIVTGAYCPRLFIFGTMIAYADM